MFEKLKGVEIRFSEIEKRLSDPEIVNDRQVYQDLIREHADLNKIVSVYREFKEILKGIEESTELLQDSDPEIKNLAQDELADLNLKKYRLEDDLKKLLLPKDPNDEKNVIFEIRAGTGGEEAALFAGDLFRMYSRYAENHHWNVEVMTHHATGVGGIKEIIAMIHGKGAYSEFKYESGIHRVQRVPTTEAQGRNLNMKAASTGFSGFRPPRLRDEFILQL
jgi:peptide chain release factor 1